MAAKAKKAKAEAEPDDGAESVILETIRRARQVFASGSGTTLSILKEADANLAAKLEAVVAKNGGPKGNFTEASATVYRKQIQLTTAYLEERLAGHTHTQAMKAIKVAVKDTVAVAKALEHKFTGITRPLALESQQFQDETIRGTGASLLRRHKSSFDRYGKTMVTDFERVLRTGAIEGLTHEQMVSRLVSSGKLGGHTGKSLHANEPNYFPEPTGYVRKRYWAERIVRTETANAHNAASLQAMNVTRNTEFPDLQKKILATFDARTAADSVAVHGQVRKLEEMFVDGSGRHYLHPPARPNDRETIIPWRPHWENSKATQPVPDQVAAEAIAAAQPSPVGEARKVDLKGALEKAKAKVLAAKAQVTAQKEQAQAFELAKAKAAAAQAQGQQALGAAILADAAALKAAAEKVTSAALPGAKFSAAKAKAEEYLKQKEALAKAKAEAQAAARQAATEAKASGHAKAWGSEGFFATPQEITSQLKTLVKTNPRVFAELYHQVTGKSAQAVLPKLAKPLMMGSLVKELGKKLQPNLEWPKPKKKAPKLTPEQELAGKKAALLKPDISSAEFTKIGESLTQADLEKLLRGNPLVEPGDIETMMKMSPMAKAANTQAALQDWEKAYNAVETFDTKEVPAGGKIYVDVFEPSGKKVAYYFKEADGSFTVTPPATLLGFTPKKFTNARVATAYAHVVGQAIAEQKAVSAPAPTPKPKIAAPVAPAPPPQATWSSKWKPAERSAAELALDPQKDLAKNLKKDRAGHAVAIDEDWIENFDVAVSLEKRAGTDEVVARFKVTGHRGDTVRRKLGSEGATSASPDYSKLKSLDSKELEFASPGDGGKVPGVKALKLKRGGVEITMLESTQGGENLAAGHNLVEVRFKGTPATAMGGIREALGTLGISSERPSSAALTAYKRAKIMAYVDSDAAKDLRALDRAKTPKTADVLEGVWKKAVQRNPKLAEIEADAELREVGPGKHALYSKKVSQMFTEAGVSWVSHNSSADVGALEQILIQDPKSGLLASRERFQRGLIFRGMSTDRDFETGGADSMFLRLQTGNVTSSPSGRWTFQIDPEELGRLDAYFFNFDNYGRTADLSARQSVDQIQHLARTRSISSSNELMLQRQVSAGSIRRIIARDASDRNQLLEKLRAAGRTEINGVPIEEFVVAK